jgi:hypothetical protein
MEIKDFDVPRGIPMSRTVQSKLADIGWLAFQVSLPALIELLVVWLKELQSQRSAIPPGIKGPN